MASLRCVGATCFLFLGGFGLMDCDNMVLSHQSSVKAVLPLKTVYQQLDF